ncbi:hypothetical protein [Zavarzinella formosa]|uniref:hypothetical protein n=1 Tax=Zavarzinella formosa TaxID=360055 RepID=UPI00037BF880|nr:hypothetical protein [Zavarzinella formosa]
MASERRRFPPGFWIGALAGGGLGLFAGVWFCEQWWHGFFMPIQEAIGIIKVVAAIMIVTGFVVAVRHRRAVVARPAEQNVADNRGPESP